MTAIAWKPMSSYMRPFESECGRYAVVRRAGGSMGPVYRAQMVAGVGIASDLGPDNRLTIDEALQDAQIHCDEVSRQQNCAARSPS